MQTLCADIERLSRAGDLEIVRPLVAQVKVEYGHVADRLQELVAEATGQPAATS